MHLHREALKPYLSKQSPKLVNYKRLGVRAVIRAE